MWILLHLLCWYLITYFLMEFSIYLDFCTYIHGVGCLGIHTYGLVACIQQNFDYFQRRLICNILVGGSLYVLFSYAPWRVHIGSYLSQTLEDIQPCVELFYYTFHACILGGHIQFKNFTFDLTWCLCLVVHPPLMSIILLFHYNF